MAAFATHQHLGVHNMEDRMSSKMKSLIGILVIGVGLICGWLTWDRQLFSEAQPETQGVAVTTDKTEYEQGETVKITMENNFDEDIYYGGANGEAYNIWPYEEWTMVRHSMECPCGTLCKKASWILKKVGESWTTEWGQSMRCVPFISRLEQPCKQAPAGKYRIAVWIKKNGKTNKIYSNEFTIK